MKTTPITSTTAPNTQPAISFQPANKVREQYQQFISEYRSFTIIVTVIVIVLIWKLMYTNADNFGWYSQWIDPLMAISTFMIAVFIWIVEIRKNWTKKLPKRLTVNYFFENRLLMRCEQVNLSSEGDIRSLALQVGAQMTNNSRLSIEPYFKETLPGIEWGNREQRYFKHYKMTFYLRELPKNGVGVEAMQDYLLTEQLVDNGVTIWRRRLIV